MNSTVFEMMKGLHMISDMKRFFFTVMAALVLVVPTFGQSRELPFRDGEDIELIIHYKCGFNADIASISCKLTEETDKSGVPCFHFIANASTYKFWDSFYKVRDIYESKFTKDLYPLYFHRDVKEGNYWAKNWYTWSKGYKDLHLVVEKSTRPKRDTVYNEGVIIRDLINMFYVARACDFDQLMAGKKLRYTMAIDRDVMDLQLRFIKREKKKVAGLGVVDAYKIGLAVTPRNMVNESSGNRFAFDSAVSDAEQTSDGVFYGDEKIFLWLSADENHIPVTFTCPVAVGSINGRLGKHDGLKYPFTSLVPEE